jgi:squalene-hopene/tetraprenyl-beta-curcumene cyclase
MFLGRAILAVCLSAGFFPANLPPSSHATNSWNRAAAAAYLDKREGWWMTWPVAARDQGTFCVSCHTALPYALARPALRLALGEQALSAPERGLLESVTKRVRLWKDIQAFYDDQKNASRATEAVLNALILAGFDASKGSLSTDTRAAFENMWTLQMATGEGKGAWPWLDFGNAPWEANESAYYGASLAAVAVGTAPENYRANPEIRNKLGLLREYLVRGGPRQSAMNQVFLLWASARWPGLIGPEQRESIIHEVLNQQQPDGGWSLSSMAWTWRGTSLRSLVKLWTRSDASPFESKSDGVATGLTAFTLQQTGLPHQEVHVQRALAWLVRNQSRTEGLWPAPSLNKRRDPSSETGRFMSDAATAFAVLALTSAP